MKWNVFSKLKNHGGALAIASEKPYEPPKYNEQDVIAMQRVFAGEGTKDQQSHVIRFIVENICDAHGMSYRPNERDTAFAEGKRFVGLQIAKLCTINLEAVETLKSKGAKK